MSHSGRARKKLRKDMRCDTIISSLDSDFSSVFMVADMWALSCDVWIGDYPYLDKRAFRQCIADATSSASKWLVKARLMMSAFAKLYYILGGKEKPWLKRAPQVQDRPPDAEKSTTLDVDWYRIVYSYLCDFVGIFIYNGATISQLLI